MKEYSIKVKVSDQFSLQIPQNLSTQLALADGDQVELVRQGDLIILQRSKKPRPPDLCGIWLGGSKHHALGLL